MTARYGQLAYTSFDAPGVAGGWRVKQSIGALTAAEEQPLVAGVRTVFRPVEPVPAYPTPEQLDRGPRRLAYLRDEDTARYWHTVPAGADSTGRPGNVFAHVVLDRQPAQPPLHRPIERWRSPLWLCPYGTAAVSAAALPATPPAPGQVVTRASVLAFVLDTSTWRLGTLLGLLDAVAAAMDGGPPVVLGVGSAEVAAQWIGLVSFLMSAGTAGTLNFSTFDRADQLDAALRSGQHLTAMPSADLAELSADVVAIDESATLSLGELGVEPHRTDRGQSIEVTAWSAMAQVVLLDAQWAPTVLDAIDRYAAEAGDAGLHVAWPMAMAVMEHPEFADAQPEARAVISAQSPHGVAPTSAAGLVVSEVFSNAVGASTADAWRAVQQARGGSVTDFANLTYLVRALADDAWLDQPGELPVSARSYRLQPVPPELSAALGPALLRAREAGPERVLKVVDLLIRSGVGDERLPSALHADVAGVLLTDPNAGSRLIDSARELSADTRLVLATEVLRDARTHIRPDAVAWLAKGISAPEAIDLMVARPWDWTWTRAALRGELTLNAGPADAADRCAALWWLRICGSPEFDQLAGAAVWEPLDLLAAAGGGEMSGTAVLPTLLGAPDSAELEELAGAVMDANVDDAAVAWAAVRVIDPYTWQQQRYVEAYHRMYTPLWEQAIPMVGLAGVHPHAAVRLLALALLAAVAGEPYPDACEALAADEILGREAVGSVLPLIDRHEIAPRAVLAVSLLRSVAHEDSGAAADGVDGLLAQLAERVMATSAAGEDDPESIATLMAQMAGSPSGLRRYRKMATKLLARRTGGPALPAAGTWESR